MKFNPFRMNPGYPAMKISMLLLATLLGTANAMAAPQVTLYMAANGSDSRDGQSPGTALQTLQRALDLAIQKATGATQGIVIQVGDGVYKNQEVVTSAHPDGIPITIQPADKAAPVFDGNSGGGTWFMLKNTSGRATNITITGMHVINYVSAVSFNGNRDDPGASNGHNVVRENVFEKIGSIASPDGKAGTAAVRMVNSDDNLITGNRFITIRNLDRCQGMHAIYIAHNSTNNRVEDNAFEDGCGQTIKVRDDSHDNAVVHNRFTRQEGNALMIDSFCNRKKTNECTKEGPECPSFGNIFEDNLWEQEGSNPDLKIVNALQGNNIEGCPPPPREPRILEKDTKIM